MEFIVSRENLIKPLAQVCAVLSSRPPMPVLHNILLEVKGGTLFITGTDAEVELTAQVTLFSATQDGVATIPGKKFLDLCRSLPDDSEITASFEQDRAIIRSGRSKFNLSTLPAEDYPTLADWLPNVSFEMAQSTLLNLINATHFAMASQDARYFLNGMKLETDGHLFAAIATDGHRLARCEEPVSTELPKHDVILPRKAVLELQRSLDTKGDTVMVQIGTNNLRVNLGKMMFTSKLLDGHYPDYRQVFPRQPKYDIAIDAQAFKRACMRMAIVAQDKENKVKLARLLFTENQLKITASNPSLDKAEEFLDIAYNGDAMEVGFNIAYLLDVLNNIKSERVLMRLTDTTRPCLLESDPSSNAQYVIMPVRL